MLLAKIKNRLSRTGIVAVAVAYTAVSLIMVAAVLQPQKASAGTVSSRSLSISSSANGTISTDINGNAVTEGTGGNGAKAKHTATFTMFTNAATIGSIAIVYCDSPILQTACTTPTGFDASNLTSATLSGSGVGGGTWSLDTSTTNASATTSLSGYGTCNGSGTTRTNCVLLKGSAASANTAKPTITITYGGGASNYIKNPTTDNYTFYARVVVFGTTTYSSVVDSGAVANSTAQQIDITAKVQETLGFSVGAKLPSDTSVTAPGSACTALSDPNSGAVSLGDANGVLSSTTAYTANSYFRAFTNASSGVIITYSGDTIKSGSNTIDAINSNSNPGSSAGTSAASTPGTKQFGLTIGSDDTTTNGYSFTNLTAATNYNSTSSYAFNTASMTTPVTIASSSGIVTCDTGSVKYLGNISTTTPPGVYKTTITYTAIPTY